MIGCGKRILLAHDPEPTNQPHAANLQQERCAVVQAHGEVQALYEKQSRRSDSVVTLTEKQALPSIISWSITSNSSVFLTFLDREQREASMDRRDWHKARRWRYSKTPHAFSRTTSMGSLLLVVLLAGC